MLEEDSHEKKLLKDLVRLPVQLAAAAKKSLPAGGSIFIISSFFAGSANSSDFKNMSFSIFPSSLSSSNIDIVQLSDLALSTPHITIQSKHAGLH